MKKWEAVEWFYLDEATEIPETICSMRCPVCKSYHSKVYYYGDPTDLMNFCPTCGADMRGGKDDG